MLTYNQRLEVIFNDAKIYTARYHNEFCGLGENEKPKNETEVPKIELLKNLSTYNEVRDRNKRTPYKEYINQFTNNY